MNLIPTLTGQASKKATPFTCFWRNQKSLSDKPVSRKNYIPGSNTNISSLAKGFISLSLSLSRVDWGCQNTKYQNILLRNEIECSAKKYEKTCNYLFLSQNFLCFEISSRQDFLWFIQHQSSFDISIKVPLFLEDCGTLLGYSQTDPPPESRLGQGFFHFSLFFFIKGAGSCLKCMQALTLGHQTAERLHSLHPLSDKL